ncbi:MAG TPA: glycoside hydrolase family 16 protein [Bacteroidia bacterium]|nr:glycoside hydrolase family 16 protein [Bacteroidia bacterium]
MKIIVFVFALIFSANVYSQVMWQVKINSSQKWYYQDGDEFNNPIIDENKWVFGMPWGNVVMNQDLVYSRNNVIVENGLASFIARKEEVSARINEWEIKPKYLDKTGKKVVDGMYDVNYTAGMLSSKRKYKYGYFELRFKANEEKGIWPAFWLFGGEPNEEIDFFELKGERENQIHLDVHCPKGCEDYKGGFLNLKKNWGAWIKTNESLAKDWNVISGEWQPNYVKFYLNGQPIGYFAGDFRTYQYLLVNTSVAKDGEPFNPGPDENTKWPNSFDVDYIRIWSKEDTVYNMKDKYKLFESSPQTISNNNLYATDLKRKVNYVYNKKELSGEVGTITLLPVFYNKYSVSFAGKNFGKVQIDVIDRFEQKVAGFEVINTEYYVMDLSALPTGPYTIKLNVLGQVLTHNVPVLNPEKIGEIKK